MAHTKDQVWAAARAAGLADGIKAIAKAFPGAIQSVSVTVGGFSPVATDDSMLIELHRVRPGGGVDARESKYIREAHRSQPKQHYKK